VTQREGGEAARLEAVHETERLRIEPLAARHAEELFEPLSDPALYRHVPRGPPASLDELRARFRRLSSRRSPDGAERWLNWVLRAGARPVGWIQATARGDGAAEIAYSVFAGAQRRGYATEGVAWMIGWLRSALGVAHLRATVDPRNAASIALLGRLGFHLVETVPAPAPIGGAPAEEHIFVLGAPPA